MSGEQRFDPVVTFVIPVRHQENARNWPALAQRLGQTVRSIAAQTHPSWRGIVVANSGAVLPALPDKFDVVRVDLPPNRLHEIDAGDLEAVYDAFRLDKGRRVLAGMLAATPTGYFMVVDDDDFVSRELVGHAVTHSGEPGWSLYKGYIWSEGGRLVLKHYQFAQICGTSHIVRSDLYGLPPSASEASDDYVKSMLGSHMQIEGVLAERGTPLRTLPFAGAVYRVGHAEAHSRSHGIVQSYLLDRSKYSRRQAFDNLKRFRLVTPRFLADFGMKGAHAPVSS